MDTETNIPIDDSDKNQRRNVLLVSVSIIAAWWFNLQAPPAMEWLKAEWHITDQPGAKLWIALFAVLTYFLLRYHFSKGRSERWEELRRDHHDRLMLIAKPVVARQVAKQINMRRATNIRARYLDIDVVHIYRLRHAGYHMYEDDESLDEFNQRYHGGEASDPIAIPIVAGLWIQVRAWLGSLVLSRGALEVNTPYLLGLAAMCICASRAGFPGFISHVWPL